MGGGGQGVDTQMGDWEARAGCWGSEGCVACRALTQACRDFPSSPWVSGEGRGRREVGREAWPAAPPRGQMAVGGVGSGHPALASSTSPASQGGSATGLLVVPADQSEPAPPCYRKWPWYPGPWSLETFLGKVNYHRGSGAPPWAQRHL